MNDLPSIPSLQSQKLSKAERKAARERIEKYHQKKLVELQKVVYDKFEEFYQGQIDAFELDYVIHIYHKQSQELFSFINTYYPSNDRLHIILSFIDEEEQGKWRWKPKTKMEDSK